MYNFPQPCGYCLFCILKSKHQRININESKTHKATNCCNQEAGTSECLTCLLDKQLETSSLIFLWSTDVLLFVWWFSLGCLRKSQYVCSVCISYRQLSYFCNIVLCSFCVADAESFNRQSVQLTRRPSSSFLICVLHFTFYTAGLRPVLATFTFKPCAKMLK